MTEASPDVLSLDYYPLIDHALDETDEVVALHNDDSERIFFSPHDTAASYRGGDASFLMFSPQSQSSSRPHQPYKPPLNGLNMLNIFTFIAHLFVNWGVGVWGLDGVLQTRWQISEMHETLLMPARWAYYLWIPILVLEGLFSFAQLFPDYRARNIVQAGTGFFFFYTFLIQTVWTLFFSFQLFICSVVAVLATLIALLALLASQRQAMEASRGSTSFAVAWEEYLLFRLPFLLHTAWMVLMTVDQFSLLFRAHHTGLGIQVAVDIVGLGILLAVALVQLARRTDISIPFVMLWSFIGIAWRLEHVSDIMLETYGDTIVDAMLYAAYFYSGIVGLCIVPNVVIWIAREYCIISVVELEA